MPGDNLRKSIFRDGLDKADVVLIFFTEKSLRSAWVDKEIKHVLKDETRKGNNFESSKLISIFDSKETYDQISERYPELTDDLLHLMPENYTKVQLGQLISAIWSKYLSLQGGDIATQRKMLEKDKELFQREKEIEQLQVKINALKSKSKAAESEEEFQTNFKSGKIDNFVKYKGELLGGAAFKISEFKGDFSDAIAFGLLSVHVGGRIIITDFGKSFFKWDAPKLS